MTRTSAVLLVPLTAVDGLPPLDPQPTDTYGPFDERQYCFTSLEVFVEDRLLEQSMGNRTYEGIVVIHTFGENHDAWWRLVTAKGEPLVANVGDGVYSPQGLVEYLGPLHDRATPLLVVSVVNAAYAGMYTATVDRALAVLDFRYAEPAILATLDCTSLGYGGGPCSWATGSLGTRTTVGCDWSAEQDDLECQLTRTVWLPWVQRTFREDFLFERNVPLAVPTPEPGFATLADFAAAAEVPGGTVPKKAFVPALGWLTRAGSWTVPGHAGTVHLFVAPSPADDFIPAFYAVDSKPNRLITHQLETESLPPALAELFKRMKWPPETHRLEATAEGMPTGPGLEVVRAEQRYAQRGLLIVEVEVAEGEGSGVFWVAFDRRGARLRSGALIMSADTGFAARCGAQYLPASAQQVTIDGPPFHANVVVDPPRAFGGVWHEDRPLACPSRAVVLWDPDAGFVAETTDTLCPEKM